MIKKILKRNSGYIALTSVLVVLALVIVFLASTQIVSTTSLQSTLANRLGVESYYVAESCLEDTLLILRSDSSYTGGSINIADGVCTIGITDTGTDEKTIDIQASTLNTYFQNLIVEVMIEETSDTIEVTLISKTRS